jgi:hypothetical protein
LERVIACGSTLSSEECSAGWQDSSVAVGAHTVATTLEGAGR